MLDAIWQFVRGSISFFADLGTIAASALAVWIFVTKRKEIAAFVKTITTFVHQNSLAELRFKLEKLNDFNANDVAGRAEAVSLLHDICGQIDGSPVLRPRLTDLCARIRHATTNGRRLTEPMKRSLVSELRESLRHLDVADFVETMREDA